MKKNQILFKRKWLKTGVIALAIAAVVGSTAIVEKQVPEIPSYTDPIMVSEIEEEETPLASTPKVRTTTSKKSSKKKVKMKKAASKTYTKSLPKTSETSKKTKQTKTATVVTKTTKVTAVKEKYTKKSKVKVVTTTTTTTVTTTTTQKASASSGSTVTAGSGNTSNTNTITGTVDVGQVAPKADSRVITAYRTLGFTVEIDPSVSYSGYFDGRNRKITLKQADDTIYHELGHFVAFIAGNVDKASSFVTVYNQEKALYTAYNKAYVTQNSSEYFAESTKNFTLDPSALKSARPKTYEAVSEALNKLTDTQIAKVQKVYRSIWK